MLFPPVLYCLIILQEQEPIFRAKGGLAAVWQLGPYTLWHQKNLLCLQSLLCPSLVLQFPNLRLDSSFCFGMGFSFHLAVDVILPGDKSLPLDVNEVLNLCVILIIPVLISPLFVTKDVFAGVHDDSGQYPPVTVWPKLRSERPAAVVGIQCHPTGLC